MGGGTKDSVDALESLWRCFVRALGEDRSFPVDRGPCGPDGDDLAPSRGETK